jgi:hypothetical protein
MSYDENRIFDQIEGGLIELEYFYQWLDENNWKYFEPNKYYTTSNETLDLIIKTYDELKEIYFNKCKK